MPSMLHIISLKNNRMNDLEKAASSAYTYFLKNMDDEVAVSNVKHFRSMPGVRESYFKGERTLIITEASGILI